MIKLARAWLIPPPSKLSINLNNREGFRDERGRIWLQERIFRFFRLRHNVGTSELRRVAMLAGYLCKDGRLTESGRIFANNLNPKELQRAQSGRNIPPASWAAE